MLAPASFSHDHNSLNCLLIKRKIDRISRFIEPLTAAQIDIIRGYTESRSSIAMRCFKNHECRQNAIVAFLRTQPEKTEITVFISRIILLAQDVVDPDPRAISTARRGGAKPCTMAY